MKRFLMDKHAMSSVIGAIFSVIIFLAGFSLIMWELNQYDNHAQVITERNRVDIERKNEIIDIVNPSIEGSNLKFSVINKGVVTAHVRNIWITEYGGTVAVAHFGPVEYSTYINPGGTSEFTTSPTDLDPQKTYLIKVVTERGNIVTKTVEPVIEPGTGGNFNAGPFVLIFSEQSFQYTSNNYPTSPQSAFEIDNDNTRIVFSVKVTNQAGQSIQISSLSFFTAVVKEGSMEFERYFYVVGPDSDSTTSGLDAFTDYSQTIHSGETATIKFGASDVGLGDSNFLSGEPLHGSADNSENLLWTFLVLFWKYDSENTKYGQTISYAAIRATA